MQTLEIYTRDTVRGIRLNRPEVRNAFNPQLITELTEAFRETSLAAGHRAALLEGSGKVFCAGADLGWMQESAAYPREYNLRDAHALAAMLSAVDNTEIPLLARVQRAAYGGALGLLACCDSVICTADCTFAFSEVRLGISRATIAPYVIRRIGVSHARDLFLSGERFDAERALRIGLVHQVVAPGELDAAVTAKLAELKQAGPRAAIATKQLIKRIDGGFTDELLSDTAALIADLRVSDEGQEGLSAFLEKRPPKWRQ